MLWSTAIQLCGKADSHIGLQVTYQIVIITSHIGSISHDMLMLCCLVLSIILLAPNIENHFSE